MLTPCAFYDKSRQPQGNSPYDGLLSLLSSTDVIRVVLSISYLLVSYFVMNWKDFRITPYIYYAYRIINYVCALLFRRQWQLPKVLNIYIDNFYLPYE